MIFFLNFLPQNRICFMDTFLSAVKKKTTQQNVIHLTCPEDPKHCSTQFIRLALDSVLTETKIKKSSILFLNLYFFKEGIKK